MAKKAATVEKKERKPRSDKKGLRAVLVRISPEQDERLTKAALRRAVQRVSSRPDKSEIVREALDAHPDLKR